MILGVYGTHIWSVEEDRKMKCENFSESLDMDRYSFDVMNSEGKIIAKICDISRATSLAKINCARGPFKRYDEKTLVACCEFFGIEKIQSTKNIVKEFKQEWTKMPESCSRYLFNWIEKHDPVFFKEKDKTNLPAVKDRLLSLFSKQSERHTPNVELCFAKHGRKLVVIYYTTKEIEENEQLFCDYGHGYWESSAISKGSILPLINRNNHFLQRKALKSFDLMVPYIKSQVLKLVNPYNERERVNVVRYLSENVVSFTKLQQYVLMQAMICCINDVDPKFYTQLAEHCESLSSLMVEQDDFS